MKTLPLTDEQRFIFDANEKSSGTPYSISFAIRFTRYFPSEQLRLAIEKCLLPADVAGAKCVATADGPYMTFISTAAPEIPAYAFASNEHYQEFCADIPEKKLNNRDRLFYVFIYAIADSCNNIHFCFNHLIFDGISCIVLYERLQEVLADGDAEVFWHPFSRHLEKIGSYGAADDCACDHDFWAGRFRELATCEPVFKDVTALDESDADNLSFQSGSEFKRTLLAYCNRNGVPPYLVIASAFAELLSARYQCRRFSIEIPIGNRVGKREKNSLGLYEVTAPFVFDFNRHQTLDALVASVRKQSKEFYRHKDFDWNSEIMSAPCVEKYGRYVPQILLSYFCFNRNCSLGFATLHHIHSQRCSFPLNLYVSDYLQFDEISFGYVFWRGYIERKAIVEMHQALENNLLALSAGVCVEG